MSGRKKRQAAAPPARDTSGPEPESTLSPETPPLSRDEPSRRSSIPGQSPGPLPPSTAGTLEINEHFRRALDLMESTGADIFITGRAGTGKSTLLDYFRATTRKQVAVLAPTGVAALNVRGQTIHSFCGFKPDITLDTVKVLAPKNSARARAVKNLEAIVIDEVSMVRADLLDCVEKFLRLNGPHPRKRFGGIQMILIGDLYQLPPVVTPAERELFQRHYETPYFFSARIFEDPAFILEFVELEKIYRQTDEDFIGLLNAIRNRSVTEADLDRLNAACDPGFIPAGDDYYVTLTSTNDLAAAHNRGKLESLPDRAVSYQGVIDGDFDRSSLPTEERLEIKIDAQVMLLTNDPFGRWVNGSIGKVTDILSAPGEDDVVMIELPGGVSVEIGPNAWEIFRFIYDEDSRKIVSEPVGAFVQYPLKLAWAITIHKSQGKTFDKVVIDIGRGTFAHGQVYVALSRCTNFSGIILKKPIRRHHIRMDWRVVKFLTRFQYAKSEERLAYGGKLRLIEEAIEEARDLDIVYLKPDDTKSRRRIRPESVEMMEYGGKRFEGLRAYCYEREDMRTFRIDRMLDIRVL